MDDLHSLLEKEINEMSNVEPSEDDIVRENICKLTEHLDQALTAVCENVLRNNRIACKLFSIQMDSSLKHIESDYKNINPSYLEHTKQTSPIAKVRSACCLYRLYLYFQRFFLDCQYFEQSPRKLSFLG